MEYFVRVRGSRDVGICLENFPILISVAETKEIQLRFLLKPRLVFLSLQRSDLELVDTFPD